MVMSLASCQSMKPAGNDTRANLTNQSGSLWVCEAFQLITFAHEDDSDTVIQIIEHNAAWEALCAEK